LKVILLAVYSVIFWLFALILTSVLYAYTNIAAIFIGDADKKREFYRKTSRLWGSILASASLVRVKVSGLENIPSNTNVIFTPNHQSYLDIFVLFKYLPVPFRFVIMRKLFNVPMIGRNIKKSGFLSLDRKDRKNSIKTIHEIIDLLNGGESFVIFPEGRLTSDGGMGEFGRGASIIIQRSMKPVVPIAIDGTFDVLPKGSWLLRPSSVRLNIGKPVYFENYYNDINKMTSSKLGGELRDIVSNLKMPDAEAVNA
jgi:1-acyl-sn-glycerol-3-phosphate acyltransferase